MSPQQQQKAEADIRFARQKVERLESAYRAGASDRTLQHNAILLLAAAEALADTLCVDGRVHRA